MTDRLQRQERTIRKRNPARGKKTSPRVAANGGRIETRLGPRPLPLHLATQATTLLGSRMLWPRWRNGSFAWNPRLCGRAESLHAELATVDPEGFAQALERESLLRIDGFLQGVDAYRHHPYQRSLPPPPVVWAEGTTRLLDYSRPDAVGPPVLVVPSLINRAYILDLTAQRSLMRYLGEKGLRAYLVDWDAPGPAESGFGLDDYVRGRLSRLLDFLLAGVGRPALVGYCMGGLLALGLACLRPQALRRLALLATPWDFHQPDRGAASLIATLRQPLEDAIALSGGLSVDLLQTLFASLDPAGIERKFRAFAHLDPGRAKARDFVALEDWLNDGVPLTARVARECLFDWYAGNHTALGLWQLGGHPILPQRLRLPALALVPARDRIVPPASALALAQALPFCQIRSLPAGHIGMITGGRAKADVYAYLTKWLFRADGD